MTSSNTVVLDRPEMLEPSNTESWAESREQRKSRGTRIIDFGKSLVISSLFSASALTSTPDLYQNEIRKRNEVITVSIYRNIAGRFVTHAEAMQFVKGIMENAERERREIDEREALLGFQWGE